MGPAKHREMHTGVSSAQQNWLRAAVLGSNDGIVSLSALMIGVAGASATSETLLVTGVAGLLAGALSMAVGEYISVSSQRDTERALLAKERFELEHYADLELQELAGLYEKKGLSHETATLVAKELTEHDVFAAHVDAELGIDPNNLTSPWQAAFASAAAFTAGAIVPVLTIVLLPESSRIYVTFGAVLAALAVLGLMSAHVSGAKSGTVVLRTVAGGALAMLITFGIGRLFNVSVS